MISVISFPIILLRARRSHDGKSAKWVAGKWFILIFRPAGLIIPELLIWERMRNKVSHKFLIKLQWHKTSVERAIISQTLISLLRQK